MYRNSLEASSKFISVKTDEKKNIIVEYREADGSALKKIVGPTNVNGLISFKITRDKDVFNVYYSTSKDDFLLLASVEIDMLASVFAGVLSYTESKDRLCSIVVDNIKTNEFETPLEEVFIFDKPQSSNVEAPNFYVEIVSDVHKKELHIITQKNVELKDASIYIYDMAGRLVLQNKLIDGQNRTIDTSSLKQGTWPYMIRIVNYDGKEISEKVYL